MPRPHGSDYITIWLQGACADSRPRVTSCSFCMGVIARRANIVGPDTAAGSAPDRGRHDLPEQGAANLKFAGVFVAYDAVTTYDWMRDDLTLPQGAVADQVAATELRNGPYGTR